MNWLLTIVFSIVAYTLFSWFGLRSAGAASWQRASTTAFTDWFNFALIMSGTVGFSLALFFAAKASAFAVTVVIALGVIVSFAFGAIVGGSTATFTHAGGLVLILVGIALLK